MTKRRSETMSCFDTVVVKCPNCGATDELQSKAQYPSQSIYSLENAPKSILGDIDGEVVECEGCGLSFEVVVEVNAYVKPKW
jgi:transcription elongation factor Elf1